MIPFHNILAG
ncbi:hypothetical protein YPPY29_1938, partial [Yersinia pestis PY-29]